MYSTARSLTLPNLSDEQHTSLLSDSPLLSLSVGQLELVLAAWVNASCPDSSEEAVALDGKTVRGAATAEHKGPHLLAFCTHQSQETLLQVRVSEKTNEIPIAQKILPCLPLRPRVYTADALIAKPYIVEVSRLN